MASPRRNARTVVLTTCVLTTLAVPLAADAKPPEHATAQGPTSTHGPSRQQADAPPPPHAKAKGHSSRQAAGDRTTASASKDVTSVDASSVDGKGQGQARGHAHAPGQAKKANGPTRKAQGATGTQQPAGQAKGQSPDAGSGDDRSRKATPASRPEPATEAPALGSGVQAVETVTDPEPEPVVPAPPAEPEPTTPGRSVWRLDVDGPFADLLEGVQSTIDRVVPSDLGPVREPLIRLVPVLLAILGAFLALQRGIGRGLGHVPMVASPALFDPPRRD